MNRRGFLKVTAAGIGTAGATTLAKSTPARAVSASNAPGGDGVSSVFLQRYKFDSEKYWDDAFGRALAESLDIVLPGRRGNATILKMASTLTIPPFTKIVGEGLFGTVLDFSSATGNGIEFTSDEPGFTHGLWLEGFVIRNAPKNGIYVDTKLAEEVWFNHITLAGCGENGIFFDKGSSGTTPLHLGHLAAFSNGNAGIHILRTHQRTAIRIQSVSGDNNGEALMRFRGGLTGGSISIGHWKCEVNGSARGKRAVLSESGQGAYIHLGNGFIWAGSSRPQSAHPAIENLGGGQMAWDSIGFDEFNHDFWPAGYRQDGPHPLTMSPREVQAASFTNRPIIVWPKN